MGSLLRGILFPIGFTIRGNVVKVTSGFQDGTALAPAVRSRAPTATMEAAVLGATARLKLWVQCGECRDSATLFKVRSSSSGLAGQGVLRAFFTPPVTFGADPKRSPSKIL